VAAKTETTTTVVFVVQSSIAIGIEWQPWTDMPGDWSEDSYDAIGKAEIFHHFMEHGDYPEQYRNDPIVQLLTPVMQEIHKGVLADQKRTKHKFRTRVVKRTIVSTVTDEEIDKAMIVKHGREG